APTWMWRGVVRAALSVGTLIHLQDPIPLCREAIADLTTALSLNPQGDEPYFWRALARIPWGVQVALRRENPEPLYREALADLAEALRLNPGRGETWLGRANIHLAWANFQTVQGKEVVDILRQAASDFDIALARNPKSVVGLSGRGAARMRIAADLAGRRENPAPLFESAFHDLEEAIRSDPAAKALRAEAYVRRGQWKAATGNDK